MLTTDKELSEAEKKRLERSRRNRRGRAKPAIMPSKLARTAAFVPRNKNLSTDANFERTYIVDGQSVVEVRGRELGSQHRDAVYALFRMRAVKVEAPNPAYNPAVAGFGNSSNKPTIEMLLVKCTWRDLLMATGKTQHVNNLMTVLRVMEEIRQVNFRVYEGSVAQYQKEVNLGRLAGPGYSDNLFGKISWDGVNLDSQVTLMYGEWVKKVFEAKHLVSVNADVYFRLKSDYAKCFWPYIDSQPDHTYIDEERLAELAGRDPANETVKQRQKFREEIRQAFKDMVNAAGLKEWREEAMGPGRVKRYRFHYVHALPRNCEQLQLDV